MRTVGSHAPFPHLIIDGFLDEKRFAIVKRKVSSLVFSRKESDLFSLEQTKDLTGTMPQLERDLLALAPTIRKLLGAKVTRIDMSAMRYRAGDHLLCHDDELEGRKVAYILYLKSPKRGGELSLLENRRPYKRKHIAPKENRLVLFLVSPKSWHEVEEVLAGERLSVGGWFH